MRLKKQSPPTLCSQHSVGGLVILVSNPFGRVRVLGGMPFLSKHPSSLKQV
uniref:Uncharacterized protein n=1 Tax=Siphoviridae sp. ct5tj9 TaxID=2823564 RepID=A0A8S5LH56_9CAUD|nr:MAG TPA: hypothetical protein [Siphoviridae sp. ct5tj9]